MHVPEMYASRGRRGNCVGWWLSLKLTRCTGTARHVRSCHGYSLRPQSMRILCVAEKPSASKQIAEILSQRSFRTVRLQELLQWIKAHAWCRCHLGKHQQSLYQELHIRLYNQQPNCQHGRDSTLGALDRP